MTDRPHTVKLKVPRDTAHLARVRDAVGFAARRIGFDETDVLRVQMAVDEVCTNVIEHSQRRPSESDAVELTIGVQPEKIQILISDHGRRFSPTEFEMPSLEDYFSAGRGHGLGIYIIRSFMDEIRHTYRDGVGNRLRLTKYLRPQRSAS